MGPGGTQAIINEKWLTNQDTSVEIISPIIDLRCALQALNFQVEWEAGVKGAFIWEASIFSDPYKWETIVNCEQIIVTTDGLTAGSCIVALTYLWLSMGFVRMRFEPDATEGSTGNANVAIRVVPT
jgi:hypothetical protein